MPRIVHAADLHIDSPMRGLVREEGAPEDLLRSATRRAFRNLVDQCVGMRADVLVLAGDLFDGNWNDNGTGAFFVREVSRLAESGTRVVFARGNHDATSEITRQMRLPPGIHELSTSAVESLRFEDLGLRLVGRGFPERAVREDYVRQFPKRDGNDFHLGVLHTNVGDAAGHGNYAPSDLASLQALGYDYMALGHVHAHAVLSRAPWVVYPGNIQGRHVKETGPKGAVRFDIEHGEVRHFERLIVDVVRWSQEDVHIDELEHLEDVHLHIEQALARSANAAEGRPSACRLHIVGASSLHDKLVAQQGALLEEARASGLRLGGAGTWVQSLKVLSRRPASMHATTALDADLDALLLQSETHAEFARSMESLRKALPNEALREHFDTLVADAPKDGVSLLRALLAGTPLS